MQESCHAEAKIKKYTKPLLFQKFFLGGGWLVVGTIIWARSTACVGKKKKLNIVVGQPERFTKFG